MRSVLLFISLIICISAFRNDNSLKNTGVTKKLQKSRRGLEKLTEVRNVNDKSKKHDSGDLGTQRTIENKDGIEDEVYKGVSFETYSQENLSGSNKREDRKKDKLLKSDERNSVGYYQTRDKDSLRQGFKPDSKHLDNTHKDEEYEFKIGKLSKRDIQEDDVEPYRGLAYSFEDAEQEDDHKQDKIFKSNSQKNLRIKSSIDTKNIVKDTFKEKQNRKSNSNDEIARLKSHIEEEHTLNKSVKSNGHNNLKSKRSIDTGNVINDIFNEKQSKQLDSNDQMARLVAHVPDDHHRYKSFKSNNHKNLKTKRSIDTKSTINDTSKQKQSRQSNDQMARLKAQIARYLVRTATWVPVSTKYTRQNFQGYTFVNPQMSADLTDPEYNGIPYFYMSVQDPTVLNLRQDRRASILYTQANDGTCRYWALGGKDGKCHRIIMEGEFFDIRTRDEYEAVLQEFKNRYPGVKRLNQSDFTISRLKINAILRGELNEDELLPLDDYYNNQPYNTGNNMGIGAPVTFPETWKGN